MLLVISAMLNNYSTVPESRLLLTRHISSKNIYDFIRNTFRR